MFVKVRGVGDLPLQRALCLDCGNVELYVKPDIRDARVNKIAQQLHDEFERWPRKSKISAEELAQKVGLKVQMLLNLVEQVRRKYPDFVLESLEGEVYFVKT